MKSIIWWCALMIILPVVYLAWWKERWRLLSGVVVLVVLAIGYWAPGEIAYSILTTETEKEKPLQKLEEILKNTAGSEPSASDTEKVKLEKKIIKLKKEKEEKWKKASKEKERGEENWKETIFNANFLGWREYDLKKEWVKKWGKKENTSAFLFCGEEFNKQLMRERKSGDRSWRTVKNYNIIDFGQAKNNNPGSLQKKIQEIYQRKENFQEKENGESPIIWFKNIDKITNSELKSKLLKVVDPKQNTNLGKCQVEKNISEKIVPVEEIIDLSQFTLVATTSTTSPQLTKELRTKLKHIEPFLEKRKWVIFFSSCGVEIIAFTLIMRSRKKSKNKSLKHLEY